jgi:vacuolar-type H+-ATPase subunit I/STV1
MGKYTSLSQKPDIPRNRGVHPVMRGFGCIMLAIVPFLSYGLAVIAVNLWLLRGLPLPPEWIGYLEIDPLLYRISGLTLILDFLGSQYNLVANLVFAFAIAIIIAGVMSIVFGYIYRLFGPPQYGPLDAPPPRVKVKRYKR